MQKNLYTGSDKSRWKTLLAGYAVLCIILTGVLVVGASAQMEGTEARATGLATSRPNSFDALTAGLLEDGIGLAAVPTAIQPTAPGASIIPNGVSLSEDGLIDSYGVVLTSRPKAPVNITVEPDGQTVVDATVLVFNKGDWNETQTVMVAAVDDNVAEGVHTGIIGHSISSNDADYSGLDADDVIATIEDNDTAGITVSPTSLAINEPDGLAAFRVSLTSEPLVSVTIPLSTSNDECGVSPAEVVLDGGNWQEGVFGTVFAVDDAVADGDQACVVQSGTASSGDPVYHGRDPVDITVTVRDNEEAGIWVRPPSLTVSEPDGMALFTITLTSDPVTAVTVTLLPSNDECRVLTTSMTLDSGNWQSGIGTTVMATDDSITDGEQTCVVQTLPVTSSNPRYHGLDPTDVVVIVQDNESGWHIYLPQMMHVWPPLPERPALLPNPNPDGDGVYSVRWSTAPRAERYVLEEAKDSAFSGAVTIYDGPSTSHDISGRGAARYFYRVKAVNSWGESAWSSPQGVDVLWEVEPNDVAPEHANGPIVSGLTYYGTFISGGDISDYYYFDLSNVGSVELSLLNIPVGHNRDLVLRDADLNLLGYSGNLGSADEHILTGTLAAGRYYAQVYNRSGTGSDQIYQLKVVYP